MSELLNSSKRFFKRNAPTILTWVGSIGVVTTAVAAVKATPKALRMIETAKEEKGEDLTKFEYVQAAVPAYVPTIIIGASTIACIFGVNTLNQRNQAALMSAYALLDSSYKEYKDKVKELYGEDADKNVRSEIAKDKYKETNVSVDENTHLYYDEYSERYFEATTEKMILVENLINRRMMESAGMFLNEYFELVGLEPTDYGDFMGWSSCELYDTFWSSWFNLMFDKVVMDDGLQVTIVRFEMDPTFDFENYC